MIKVVLSLKNDTRSENSHFYVNVFAHSKPLRTQLKDVKYVLIRPGLDAELFMSRT